MGLILFLALAATAQGQVGGPIAPDGTPIQIPLPGSLHQANISVRGAGCCVFRSLDHAARWANVPVLIHMPEWMKEKGIAGGGWPEKVNELIEKISSDRGLSKPEYIQIENSRDLEVLRAATKSGRMISVTYSRSPTGRYGGNRIAHMVNAAHFDARNVAILDNNYPGADKYEWITPDQFLKICNPSGYWAVILLTHGPPPPPKN